eukprot:jgi/Phyca11/14264/fgenesh1_pg.PHYCAscaffold_7_\
MDLIKKAGITGRTDKGVMQKLDDIQDSCNKAADVERQSEEGILDEDEERTFHDKLVRIYWREGVAAHERVTGSEGVKELPRVKESLRVNESQGLGVGELLRGEKSLNVKGLLHVVLLRRKKKVDELVLALRKIFMWICGLLERRNLVNK